MARKNALQNAAEIAATAGSAVGKKAAKSRTTPQTPPTQRNPTKKRKSQPTISAAGKVLGRPSGYSPDMDLRSYKLCLLGYTNKELGEFWNVSEGTITDWMASYPSFGQAILRGREPADSEVAERYFQLARGYVHRDTVINMHQRSGAIVKTRVLKYYPPNEKAAATWLRNRQPKRWRQNPEGAGINSPEEAARLLREALAAMEQCEEGEGASDA